MGLIDFMKNAGSKLFGGDDDKEIKKESLIKHVRSLGLPVDNLNISVDDDTVRVSGKVDSAAHAEKIALALGNVEGVSKVDNDLEVEQKEAATSKPAAPSPDSTRWRAATACRRLPSSTTVTLRSTTKSLRPTSRCSAIPTKSTRGRCCASRSSARLRSGATRQSLKSLYQEIEITVLRFSKP